MVTDATKYKRLKNKYNLESLPEEFKQFRTCFPIEQFVLNDDTFPLDVCLVLEEKLYRNCELFMGLNGENVKLTQDEVEIILNVVNSNNETESINRLRKGAWTLTNARINLEKKYDINYLCKVINEEFNFYKETILPLVETVTSKLKTLPNSKKRPIPYIS
jgi:hypothetical protein